MTQYQLFLFLHIVSVILWLGAGTVLGVLWLHPDPALRERIGSLGKWLGPRVFAPGAFGALAFGLVLVHQGSWTFHPLWVKLGLTAFVVSFVINAAIRAPLVRRGARASRGASVVCSLRWRCSNWQCFTSRWPTWL
jgi:hypothetical protein